MILITGITGFLGQHLTQKLVQRGESIIGLSRKSGSLKVAGAVVLVFSEYDIDLSNLFRTYGVTKVIHCATDYGRDNTPESGLERANYLLPKKLYSLATKFGCELFVNCESFLQKGNDTGRNSRYISSKNKLRTHLLSKPRVTRYVSLQLEHMYGPNDNPSKLIPHIINRTLIGAESIELGRCNLLRDLVYIDDVVSAFLVVLDKYHLIEEELLEVGAGVSIDLKQAVLQLQCVLNSKMTHGSSEMNVVFNDENTDQLYQSVADISHLKKLGWMPMVSLTSGFEKIVERALKDATGKL